VTNDCSLDKAQGRAGGGLCLRCGSADCNAAEYSDWFRCVRAARVVRMWCFGVS
jgi:hypothetical protein